MLPAAPAVFATVADIEVACGAATTSSLSYTNGLDGDCEISGSVTSTLSALPTTYCGGDVTETWSFTDLCGRTISTSRTITVLPAAPAVFATVADIEVACGAATTSSLSYTNGLDGDLRNQRFGYLNLERTAYHLLRWRCHRDLVLHRPVRKKYLHVQNHHRAAGRSGCVCYGS